MAPNGERMQIFMPAAQTLSPIRDSSRRARAARPVPALRVERTADGQLSAHKDGAVTPVRVCRCFPWLEPGRFVSLRDEKENEVALIADLGDLDPESRALVEAALAEAGFLLEIERSVSAEEIFEVRHWVVRTRQGPRTFQTPHDGCPRKLPTGGYLIRDVAGDLFHIARPEALDSKSQQILWALVD